MISIISNEMYLKLILAMALGLAIGVERFFAHKTAGMRTYALISMGSALFILISITVAQQYIGIVTFDPLRMAAQIVAAAGFLGVGAIFHTEQRVNGITTASGLWVSAGIGMACGFGLYQLAILVTGLTLFIFAVLWVIELRIEQYLISKGDTGFKQ